jgi:lysophospholipase L1-like esterase
MYSRRDVVLFASAALGAFAQGLRPIKIVIAGDSTVANYPPEQPARGWGMYLPEYFQPNVTFVNLAKNGRSTKTFRSEGLWVKALSEKPDFVLIQFGHNDSHDSSKPESTGASTGFKQNLRWFIDESRAVAATPILITPMQRRTPKDTLLPYAEAMKQVAQDKKVSLIDLHAMSGRLYKKLGPEGTATLASESTDQTHFNEKGARAMAALIMEELPQCDPALAASLTLNPKDSGAPKGSA